MKKNRNGWVYVLIQFINELKECLSSSDICMTWRYGTTKLEDGSHFDVFLLPTLTISFSSFHHSYIVLTGILIGNKQVHPLIKLTPVPKSTPRLSHLNLARRDRLAISSRDTLFTLARHRPYKTPRNLRGSPHREKKFGLSRKFLKSDRARTTKH